MNNLYSDEIKINNEALVETFLVSSSEEEGHTLTVSYVPSSKNFFSLIDDPLEKKLFAFALDSQSRAVQIFFDFKHSEKSFSKSKTGFESVEVYYQSDISFDERIKILKNFIEYISPFIFELGYYLLLDESSGEDICAYMPEELGGKTLFLENFDEHQKILMKKHRAYEVSSLKHTFSVFSGITKSKTYNSKAKSLRTLLGNGDILYRSKNGETQPITNKTSIEDFFVVFGRYESNLSETKLVSMESLASNVLDKKQKAILMLDKQMNYEKSIFLPERDSSSPRKQTNQSKLGSTIRRR